MLGASSCITTPSANSFSMMPPRARSTTIPPASASAAVSSISELLPMPAAPSITTTPPAPPAAASSAPAICSNSPSRSRRSVRLLSSAIRRMSAREPKTYGGST